MRYLILLFLLPVFSQAQKTDKGFFMGAMQADFPKEAVGGGIRLGGGASLNNQLLLGAGIGLTKFQFNDKPNIPLFASLIYGNFNKKATPVFIAEPGINIYNATEKIGNVTIERKGSLYFHGGAGIGFRASQKVRGVLSVGYSLYQYKTFDVKSNAECIAVRFTAIGL
jgi:hypothetical protein